MVDLKINIEMKEFDKMIIQIRTLMNQSLDSVEFNTNKMSNKEEFTIPLNIYENLIRLNQTKHIYLTASNSISDLNLLNNQIKKLNQKVKLKLFYFLKNSKT